MSNQKDVRRRELAARLPSVEAIQRELGKAESIDDFFGKDGIFSRLFAETLETLLEAELTEQLGYERYEAKGRRSGNSRNGKRSKRVRTSGGETIVQVPRDRNGEYQPTLLEKHKANSNEIEAKVLALYGKGNSTRDIEAILEGPCRAWTWRVTDRCWVTGLATVGKGPTSGSGCSATCRPGAWKTSSSPASTACKGSRRPFRQSFP